MLRKNIKDLSSKLNVELLDIFSSYFMLDSNFIHHISQMGNKKLILILIEKHTGKTQSFYVQQNNEYIRHSENYFRITCVLARIYFYCSSVIALHLQHATEINRFLRSYCQASQPPVLFCFQVSLYNYIFSIVSIFG